MQQGYQIQSSEAVEKSNIKSCSYHYSKKDLVHSPKLKKRGSWDVKAAFQRHIHIGFTGCLILSIKMKQRMFQNSQKYKPTITEEMIKPNRSVRHEQILAWCSEIMHSDWMLQVTWLVLTNQSALIQHGNDTQGYNCFYDIDFITKM